ncbi:hypothetical protein [Nocardia nepalensis]|uniref:hypothetical protein n=1 Tax=Nocardia nepalensis TaxID=3375448 RepID=UPI003B67C175
MSGPLVVGVPPAVAAPDSGSSLLADAPTGSASSWAGVPSGSSDAWGEAFSPSGSAQRTRGIMFLLCRVFIDLPLGSQQCNY